MARVIEIGFKTTKDEFEANVETIAYEFGGLIGMDRGMDRG